MSWLIGCRARKLPGTRYHNCRLSICTGDLSWFPGHSHDVHGYMKKRDTNNGYFVQGYLAYVAMSCSLTLLISRAQFSNVYPHSWPEEPLHQFGHLLSAKVSHPRHLAWHSDYQQSTLLWQDQLVHFLRLLGCCPPSVEKVVSVEEVCIQPAGHSSGSSRESSVYSPWSRSVLPSNGAGWPQITWCFLLCALFALLVCLTLTGMERNMSSFQVERLSVAITSSVCDRSFLW